MTEVDIQRIERELGLILPPFYRSYLPDRADEVHRLVRHLRAQYDAGWVTIPHTTADEIIALNQYLRRDVAAGDRSWWVVGEDRQPWPVEGRLLIGDSGAGGYCFIRTDESDQGLWWWDHETVEFRRSHPSLEEFYQELSAELEQERQWAAEEADQ